MNVDSKIRALALLPVIEQVLEKLISDVAALAPGMPPGANDLINTDVRDSLVTSSPKPKLASLMLRCEHLHTVEVALASAIA